MPTVRPGQGHKGAGNGHIAGQVVRNSTHIDTDAAQMHHDAFGRDDLKGAYAGKQNEAKFHREDHATNVKGRSTKKSKTREPKM
jgi:hypothetical protein